MPIDLSLEEPPHWPRFQELMRANAPTMPGTGSTQIQQDVAQAAQAYSILSAVLTALGVPVPASADIAVGVGSSGSAGDLANVGVDAAAGHAVGVFMAGTGGGPAPGMIVGNGIAVLRGAVQAVERSDEMENFLNQFSAYVTTLARTAIGATRRAVPYAQLPDPLIPTSAEEGGSLYSQRTRGSYARGARRVTRVISGIDELRPTDGRDWYSKRNFTHLYMLGNPNLVMSQTHDQWRVRQRLETLIMRNILVRNLMQERERVRRWAMTG